jgi:DNA-binding response OmpR family regulator
MVLEDEAMIAMLLEDMLAELGCKVLGPVGDVAAALNLIALHNPQVALLDVSLSHGQSSYQVAEALARRGVPFAFVTGHGPGGLQPPFRDHPMLQKPFHLSALVDVVSAAVRVPSPQ